ncbi:MAG: FecR domain-containing protein [Elusimicrobia bacterium]|nr:FecR domain-containing protein [Elusimicrobiota bacterium]
MSASLSNPISRVAPRRALGRGLAALALAAALPLPGHALWGFGSKPKQPELVPVASVGALEGSAQYQAQGAGAWSALTQGQKLGSKDAVKTAAGAKVTLAFSDGSKLQIGGNAVFAIDDLQSKKMGVSLTIGLLDAWVAKLKGRRFTIRTPTAVASVRGTQLQVNVDAAGHTDVFCFSGGLDVAPPTGGQAVFVEAGKTVKADAGGTVTPPVVTPPTVVAPPEPIVSIPAPEAAPTQAPVADEGKKEEPAAEEPKAEEPTPDEPKPDEPKPDDPKPPPPNPLYEQQILSPSGPQ